MLRCPSCRKSSFFYDNKKLICNECSTRYPIVKGVPVLIDGSSQLFSVADFTSSKKPIPKKNSLLRKLLPTLSVNLSFHRIMMDICSKLEGEIEKKILIVGSGEQRSFVATYFNKLSSLEIICTDIDIVADVDYFCDAHNLPFKDETFNVVIITAVLEHVIDPFCVTNELHRVLKKNGLIYSEIPFMQQVHEGAYDFMRFSKSGQRFLFKEFNELEAGVTAGPATAFLWAFDFLLLSIFRGGAAIFLRVLLRFTLFWIKYLDLLLVSKVEIADGASCIFFYGVRSEKQRLSSDIISMYDGLKHLKHQ